jgi:hypothetical protein
MSDMGPGSTANTLRNLWAAAADSLTTDQLKWFGGLDNVQMEAENIAKSLEAMAIMLGSTDKSALPDDETLVMMLHSFSYQVETIASLIEIAGSATDRLRNPEGYEMIRKAKAKPKD